MTAGPSLAGSIDPEPASDLRVLSASDVLSGRGDEVAQERDGGESSTIGRRHGPKGGWVLEDHQAIDAVAHLFGVTIEIAERLSSRGKWPHIKQPIAGRPGFRRMFCEHDLAHIADSIEQERLR